MHNVQQKNNTASFHLNSYYITVPLTSLLTRHTHTHSLLLTFTCSVINDTAHNGHQLSTICCLHVHSIRHLKYAKVLRKFNSMSTLPSPEKYNFHTATHNFMISYTHPLPRNTARMSVVITCTNSGDIKH